MKVADFFCGGGGFSEGFRQAGFEIVFAVDNWSPAVKTYKGNNLGINVIQDDVIRISQLPDDEFNALVPDTEIIIGSPPCKSFSHSNKSGNADKSIGIQLIEAYLRIIARKKFKPESILRYWVLENVPAVKNHIKEQYTAADFGLEGDFVLRPHDGASGKYNAKYFGAPTNRERYFCGEFPAPIAIKNDSNVTTLRMVLESLGNPLRKDCGIITDINYPDLSLECQQVTDCHYLYELAEFEYETSKRLKQDRGYMGRMSFPENIDKPARTVMATMTMSARESMILGYGEGRYRLPTVREAASMMSFPIDYWFYGESKGIKHTLVGNAVPPKMSYAIAKAIAEAESKPLPESYLPIKHDETISFVNLNGAIFDIKKEKPRRPVAKFKYHIPYLIINAYRVELTNYNSDFEKKKFRWDAEIHYSQGKDRARIYSPLLKIHDLPKAYHADIEEFLSNIYKKISDMDSFQKIYCMVSAERKKLSWVGPYELLFLIRDFIDKIFTPDKQRNVIYIEDEPYQLPLAIATSYYVLLNIVNHMGGKNDGCCYQEE
ncbi:MAG TPA: DNA cytosine methyltransferase [Clostridia bacterium]|jgi:DNA (cytosine-5)-methyltransferase 1|nr:MAG: Modification methylase HaeIII [Firmicutes bacterium ADurb.Bin146]HPY98722.1 DNA cytosine methyltransferase [Clostridia bacterium]HQC68370.1 DNA cytosine methyltransferase [Clostridia bacterium]